MAYSASNVTPNLDLVSFNAKLNELGSVAKGCRFAVKIRPEGRSNHILKLPYVSQIQDLTYLCDAAEFPGRGFGVTPMRYYGPTVQFPNNVEYGPASLSIICRTVGIERQFFDDWQDIINPTNTYNFNYQDDYACTIEIIQFAEYGQSSLQQMPTGESVPTVKPLPVYSWRLYKAWPTLVNPQQVTWADSDILRLQVTFAYKYWDRPGDTVRIIDRVIA